jgi:hypothetical protein
MDLTFLRNPEYQSFRKNLDYIWSDEHPEGIEKLKLLMFQRGFRVNKDGRNYPSSKQTEIAWEYIKQKSEREHYISEGQTATVTKTYRTVKVKGYSYKRGNKTVTVNGYERRYIIRD